MKERKRWFIGFAMLFLCVFLLKGNVQAANYRPVAYINQSKEMIFKAKGFCKDGYNYTLTMEGEVVLKGKLSVTNVGEDFVTKINLQKENCYKPKKRYVLTVTGRDKAKKSITANYYTGISLKRSSASQSKKGQIIGKAKMEKGYKCSGQTLVYDGPDSTSMFFVQNMKAGKGRKATELTGTIPAGKLWNSTFRVYNIMIYKIGGQTYFGQGYAYNFDYVKPQSKVGGIRLSTSNCEVHLTWKHSPAASYYKVYQSSNGGRSYKLLGSKVRSNSYTTCTLKGGKRYYYKIQSVGVAGKKTLTGKMSRVKSIKVPKVAGRVKDLRFAYSMDEELVLKWDNTMNANGYTVYYKKSSEDKFKKLGSTENNTYPLTKLDGNTKYDLQVLAYRKENGKIKDADSPSKVITITPAPYMKANRELLLANGVRTIQHINGSRSVYTKKHYSAETKRAFVNRKGYSSPTKYLIWVSHYTQQVTIFTGSKGNWKIHKTFICATGRACTPSPTGVFKITYKEYGWFDSYTKEIYVSHYCGRNSFHTRPLYYDGSVSSPAIGQPASHGCVRCYNADAKYIYDHIPVNTTVVSW